MAALAEKISLGEAIGGVMKIRVRIVFDFEGFFWIFLFGCEVKIVRITCGNGRVCVTREVTHK